MVGALLDPHADPVALLRSPPDDLPPAARGRLRDPDLRNRAARILDRAAALELTVLTPDGPGYPERLGPAPLRPNLLFRRGDGHALDPARPAVAVVGSRTPTPYGRAAALDFCGALARAGIVVWSGLAYGIDALAHEAALQADGPTVAVLAGGLAAIEPQGHARLAERIVASGGALLAEPPPDLRPRRGHFPRRNRILARAVDAVLVVEAGLASGSLHTARFAADVGVPVFAVPGPYTSPRSRGCHQLLGQGACIALDPAELLRDLGVAAADGNSTDLALRGDLAAVYAALAGGPRPIDLVARETGLTRPRFLEAMVDGLTTGVLVRLAGDLLARGESGRA